MDPEHAAVLLPLLILVVGGGFLLLLMGLGEMDTPQSHEPKGKRDFVREHHLGSHKSMPAWGCPMCGEGKR